jgi:hypothetical protein
MMHELRLEIPATIDQVELFCKKATALGATRKHEVIGRRGTNGQVKYLLIKWDDK